MMSRISPYINPANRGIEERFEFIEESILDPYNTDYYLEAIAKGFERNESLTTRSNINPMNLDPTDNVCKNN
jgi:hypothetical protein